MSKKSFYILMMLAITSAIVILQRNPSNQEALPVVPIKTTHWGSSMLGKLWPLPASQKKMDGPTTSDDLAETTKDFKILSGKALRTTPEQKRFDDILSDVAISERFLQALTEDSAESIRMEAITFLSTACEWNENPARTEILGKIADYLSSEFPEGPLSEEKKKSLLADRIELFTLVAVEDPSLAEKLKLENESPLKQRIFRLAENLYVKPYLNRKMEKPAL